MNERIYLDNAASSRLSQVAFEAMRPWLYSCGNPSSAHEEGRRARLAIDRARETIATYLDAKPEQVFFLPSATAANNVALDVIGWVSPYVLTTQLEHPSVLRKLEIEKNVRYIPLDREGRVNARQYSQMNNGLMAINASVCWVCSETGVINPIPELARISAETSCYFHTDATQAVGHIPLFSEYDPCKPDFLTFGAHKFGGPRGVGVLCAYNDEFLDMYLKDVRHLTLIGGHQERGLWPGTENTAAIVGCAAALEYAVENMEECKHYMLLVRDRLIGRLSEMPVVFNTPKDPANCVNGIVNVSVPGMDGAEIVMLMDEAGIAVSSGSACSTGSGELSRAILAIAHDDKERARGSVRFSFNEDIILQDIDAAMDAFERIITEHENH